jgi:hypothetical protein
MDITRKIPSLDIAKVTGDTEILGIKRSRSYSCLESLVESRIVSLERASAQYKNISKSIDDIKEHLNDNSLSSIKDILNDLRTHILFEYLNIGHEIKSVKSNLGTIISGMESSPRVISRVDAVVGNGQALINRFDGMKKEIMNDIYDHDRVVQIRIDRIEETQDKMLDMICNVVKAQDRFNRCMLNIERILEKIEKDYSEEDSSENSEP